MTEAAAISERPTRKPRAKRQLPTVRRQDLLAITVSCLARLGPRGATGRESTGIVVAEGAVGNAFERKSRRRRFRHGA